MDLLNDWLVRESFGVFEQNVCCGRCLSIKVFWQEVGEQCYKQTSDIDEDLIPIYDKPMFCSLIWFVMMLVVGRMVLKHRS